jgi:hypothetical protein
LASTDQVEEASNSLYGAIENVRNISLCVRKSDDTEHQEKLGEIANNLGYEGEYIINQNSISKGLYFFPKYLNESIVDYPDERSERPVPRLRSDL